MVRTKTVTRIAVGCLALLLQSPSFANDFRLGELTQSKGEISYLGFASPHTVLEVKKGDVLKTEGSYFTKEQGHFTAKLFDGSWLRVSPRTKISLGFNAQERILELTVFVGSVKVLFSSATNQNKVAKIIVRHADTFFESTEGKFSVVRNPLTSETSVFVEKGLVTGYFDFPGENKDKVVVHTKEMSSVKDRTWDFDEPKSISENQLKFLNSTFYLGGKNTDGL